MCKGKLLKRDALNYLFYRTFIYSTFFQQRFLYNIGVFYFEIPYFRLLYYIHTQEFCLQVDVQNLTVRLRKYCQVLFLVV